MALPSESDQKVVRAPGNAARSALASPKPEWIIEGYGVDPDIVVENDPKSEIEGRDPQLERAVSELVHRLDGQKAGLPPRPAAPIKTEQR